MAIFEERTSSRKITFDQNVPQKQVEYTVVVTWLVVSLHPPTHHLRHRRHGTCYPPASLHNVSHHPPLRYTLNTRAENPKLIYSAPEKSRSNNSKTTIETVVQTGIQKSGTVDITLPLHSRDVSVFQIKMQSEVVIYTLQAGTTTELGDTGR
ncbi:hypothetical protein J6590_044251 [Homalodisca vitripennis]|nr:hypothetical protein J6590_044251 [Homalodisca vitripennis]